MYFSWVKILRPKPLNFLSLSFCQLVEFSDYSTQSAVSTSSVIELFLTQGYEDWVRHRGDGAINRKLVTKVDTESVNQIHVFESCFSNKILPSYGIQFLKRKWTSRIQIPILILVRKSSGW